MRQLQRLMCEHTRGKWRSCQRRIVRSRIGPGHPQQRQELPTCGNTDVGDSDGVDCHDGCEIGSSRSGQLHGLEVGTDGSEQDDEPALASEWKPGWSAGHWVNAMRPPDAQSQVLIVNVYLACQRIPGMLRQHLFRTQHIHPHTYIHTCIHTHAHIFALMCNPLCA